MIRIPFNFPRFLGKEMEYIHQALELGQISGNGMFSRKCQELLEKELGVQKVLLTGSCTQALEMAALLLDIQPDDEVIVPSFTFVSTVNAFLIRGARPVFVDIRPDTLNMDEKQIAARVNLRTRAIIPVHYAGVGCEMDPIIRIAEEFNLPVVEDNAHGLFGKYNGKYLGTFGRMAAQSFHETKNFTCGEGGALIVNDARYMDRAEIIHEKGTNRSKFFRGLVDKYTWIDIGSSYVLSDILAAFLYGQLELRASILEKRRAVWAFYYENLQDWAKDRGTQLPIVPPYCEQSYHMFYMLLPSLEKRQSFIAYLKSHGISSVFHYVPLHLSPMGRRMGGKNGLCPVTEDVSARLVRLPFFNSIKIEEVAEVVSLIKTFA